MSGFDPSANPITAELVCNGDLKGKGSLKVFQDSNASYKGSFEFSGLDKRGAPVAMQTSFTARWLAADCGNVQPLPTPGR